MHVLLAIIIEDSKVLVGKVKPEKISEYGGIKYAFPSVSVNDKKNIRESLTQEIKSQSNLDIYIVDKIGERKHPMTQNLTEYYFCKQVSQQQVEISQDEDVEEFIWVEIQQLTKYMPSLFEKVKDYLYQLNQ